MRDRRVGAPTAPHRTGFALPGWRVEFEDYVRLCRHLGLTASPSIYLKLTRYLRVVSASQGAPVGFGLWLSEIRPAPMALRFLDVWTRLCCRSNPWRYKLNAVVALHECDAVGFNEMCAPPAGALRAWGALVLSALEYVGEFIIGALWLAMHAVLFLVIGRRGQRLDTSFSGRTVLVTGASRGIGLELTCRLIGSGAKVIALGRQQGALVALSDEAAEAGQGRSLQTVAADVAIPGAVAAAIAQLRIDAKDIDVVFVNAGVKESQEGALDIDAIRRTFSVNLFGAVETVQPLLPAWIRRGTGHLVFVSSLGRWHGMVSSGGYNASKAALSVLADSLALDLATRGASGIQVTTVEPGLVNTALVGRSFLQVLLSISPNQAARAVLRAAGAGRQHSRFPVLFTILTVGLVVAPRWLRMRVLNRVKEESR